MLYTLTELEVAIPMQYNCMIDYYNPNNLPYGDSVLCTLQAELPNGEPREAVIIAFYNPKAIASTVELLYDMLQIEPGVESDLTVTPLISYDAWYEENEESLWERAYESGAINESDFNPEADFDQAYQEYIEKEMR